MPGGLVQIVAYGSQDLFLTSIPQITFFKIVFKKYTNFAIESIEIPLDGSPNFDSKSLTIIPKTGDLIYKFYLKINIPSVMLINNNSNDNSSTINSLQSDLIKYNSYLTSYYSFFKYNFIIINQIKQKILTIDFNWNIFINLINNLKQQYSSIINTINVNLYSILYKLESTFPNNTLKKNQYYGSEIANQNLIKDINILLSDTINYYTQKEDILYQSIKEIKQSIDYISSNLEYFSWIENLGFNIINKCSILIGGSKITEFDSDFLNVYYSLNNKFKLLNLFNKMIGNVSELTNYDNKTKPNYTLYIPLPFWFNNHNGNTLPLVSLKYHDVEFYCEFSSLNKCCFYNGQNNLSNIIQFDSGCSILVDYIFLDADERKKFAQFSHEYLIQTTQNIFSSEINSNKLSLPINFMHPIKELYWFIKETSLVKKYKLNNLYYLLYVFEISNIEESNNFIKIYFKVNDNSTIYFSKNNKIVLKYTQYYDGVYDVLIGDYNYIIIKAKFTKYTNYYNNFFGIIYNFNNDNQFNPIESQYISLNNQFRTENTDSKYYNYVIPYQYYSMNLYDGINVYSFSINPLEYQPSGSCNFTIIKDKFLNLKLNNDYYNYIVKNNLSFEVNIYGINYNVIRLHNGICSLIFS